MFHRIQLDRRTLMIVLMVAVMAVMAMPAMAQTTTPTLEVDFDGFFDQINAYLPMFISIFGVAAAIAGAAALVRMVLSAIVDALSGKF